MKIYDHANDEILFINDNQVFIGPKGQYGIILLPRGKDDKHIIFAVIVEDDENWFISQSGGSSYYLTDLAAAIARAEDWMHEYADIDPDKYGFVFRT